MPEIPGMHDMHKRIEIETTIKKFEENPFDWILFLKIFLSQIFTKRFKHLVKENHFF